MMKTLGGLVAALLAVAVALPATAEAAPRPGTHPLTFGVYPGGYAGGGSTNSTPDDPAKIKQALNTLQGNEQGFLVRTYVSCGSTDDPRRYLANGRRLDLVIVSPATPPDNWLDCVRDDVRRLGPWATTISITLEANLSNNPALNKALVDGVIAAKREARRLGYWWLRIGFNEVAYGRVATDFWNSLNSLGGKEFSRSVDYVGVDIYPDVFHPQPDDIAGTVSTVLKTVRDKEMPIAGLSAAVPIRVSENGWPTIGDRTEQRQAATLRTIIETVDARRVEDNIVSYELFSLRDGLTSSANMFDHFGIMRDDYTPKPAFDTFRQLVSELGRRS